MLMLKSQEKATDAIWLRLSGYRVTALKPEFREQATRAGDPERSRSLSGHDTAGFL
jgi:hypothetical protein